MSFSELRLLCEHYQISLDRVMQLDNDTVLFQAPEMNKQHENFSDYLKGVLQQFKYFNSTKNAKMFILCKDALLWAFYLFPELASFKTFFWAKTIQNHAELSKRKFSLKEFPYDDCFRLGQEIIKEYNELTTIELWNIESMNSTINQIAYYRDAGMFEQMKDFDLVVDSFLNMIDHLQLQAEKGMKFLPGATEISYRGSVQFYVNELILGNNTFLLELDGKRASMITYSVLKYLVTRDARFTDKAFENFNVLLSRSTLISGTGEKERNKFFNQLRTKVKELRS